jgi:hypothetical protein
MPITSGNVKEFSLVQIRKNGKNEKKFSDGS